VIHAAWLTAGALVIGAVCVVLAAATAIGRAIKDARLRREARLLRPVRPLVLQLAADADDDGDALRALSALDTRTWACAEPLVVKMLGQIRGEARAGLVALLKAHGAGRRARIALRSRNLVRRAMAAETLGALRERESASPLLGLLKDPSPDVRQVAVRALGYTGDPAASPQIIEALASVPAQTVAQTLLRLGPQTAPTLIEALGDERENVRAVAVEVLGRFQAVAAVRPLAAMLATEPSALVQVRVAAALGRLGHPGALGPLIAVLASRYPPGLRAAAAAALGQLGAPNAVTPLGELLSDPSHAVATSAAAALARLGPLGVGTLTDIVAADPPPGGQQVVVQEGGRHRAVPPGQAGAHAAAALDAVPRERGRLRA
jgi:HEAT repeat protein